MPQPLILVTAGEIHNKFETWSPVAHGQSVTFLQAVQHAGGTPIIVPVLDDDRILRRLYELAAGILFSGGNDISPRLYGQEPFEPTDVSELRDAVEVKLMRWALADKKPMLCICRGMHLLNALQGGTCYQDIEREVPHAIDHESSTKKETLVDIAHTLKLEPGSQLATILGVQTVGTNTHHHQAIKKLGNGVIANSWSRDGLIEGIELANTGWAIGVQSHPESLEAEAEPLWRKMFEAFVNESAAAQ